MNKTVLIITAAFILLAVAIGATYAISATGSNGTLFITAADSGKQITLNAGDSLIVTLDSNPSTGYSWTNASISNGSVIKETSREFKAAATDMVGAGGQDTWTFKTLEKGTSTISMNYSRPWEKDVAPVATFNVTIIVK